MYKRSTSQNMPICGHKQSSSIILSYLLIAGRKKVRKTRKARTILSIILVGAFLVLGIGGIQAQEPPKKEDTLSIIEALEKGYISEIGIEGSENEIKLSIERTSEKRS